MLKLIMAAGLTVVAIPAAAQTCLPLNGSLMQLHADGDSVTGPIAVQGAHIDSLYIDLDANGVWIWAAQGTCLITPPLHIDMAPGAASEKPAAVVHGAGPELSI